jgi:hypothetical protein
MDSNSELAIELGLKPYAEFEQMVSPVLARVPPKSRNQLLQEIYELAAQKVLMEGGQRGAEAYARAFRKRRRKLRWTRAHIQNARKALLKAELRFPQGHPQRFNIAEIIAKLTDINEDFERADGAYLSVQQYLENLEGTRIEAQTSSASKYTALFPDRRCTASDKWFISAVNELLPEEWTGPRSPVWPNKLIKRVFEAAFGDVREIERIKKARSRLRKRPADDRGQKP